MGEPPIYRRCKSVWEGDKLEKRIDVNVDLKALPQLLIVIVFLFANLTFHGLDCCCNKLSIFPGFLHRICIS